MTDTSELVAQYMPEA